MSINVLIIDDDARILQTFARNLQLAGYAVLTSDSGQGGLDVYAHDHPEIVLVDVRMPAMDGFGVLKAIRQQDVDAEVILVTGHGDVNMAIEAMRAGASDFIPKPVERETLMAALQRAAERLRLRRELRAAQEALRASEEHYRAITETAFVGVAIIAPGGALTFVNQAFAEMTGYTRDELVSSSAPSTVEAAGVGMNFAQLTSAEAFAHYQAMTVDVETGSHRQFETLLHHKNGMSRSVLFSATPLQDADGRYQGTLAVIADITELKKTQAELEEERALLTKRVAERTAALSAANVELARAARLKDEFLANTSHELRTPLNAILGMSEVLRREIYGPLNERQQRYVRTIEESGQHLLHLINDILDLSKIEAGKTTLQVTPFPVAEVCRESVKLIQQIASEKHIAVALTVSDERMILNADKRRLKQILVNLLSNAVKFTPRGGQIGLDVVGDRALRVMRLTVWDTGIGIAPEDGPRLFRPFIQLDSSLSRQHEGTGLGLALVYRLTRMHGGSISLESTVNQGSRFTVSLPWALPDATMLNPDGGTGGEALPSGGLIGRTESVVTMPPVVVLLAEDNDSNIDTFTGYLTAAYYDVVVVRDGRETLGCARETRPDVILMDIHLPGMDGMEAIRRIRADELLHSVPIIAVTALMMPGDRERCLHAGANAYLSKPISLEELTQAINIQLSKKGA